MKRKHPIVLKTESFNELVKDIEVHKTNTREPLKFYSKIISGNKNSAIPIGFAGKFTPWLFSKNKSVHSW